MHHQLETAMLMGVGSGDLYQASANSVILQIVDRAKAMHVRHVLVVHANANRPDNLSPRLGDPEMILRPKEIGLLNLIDVRRAVAIHSAAWRGGRPVEPHDLRSISGLKASDEKSV
jgi:hypothetical protein